MHRSNSTLRTGVVRLLTGSSLTSLFGDTEALCFLVILQIAFVLTAIAPCGVWKEEYTHFHSALLPIEGLLCVKQQQCFFFIHVQNFQGHDP